MSRAATPFGDLYLLADGVGGHAGGAEAAQMTVDGFAAYLRQHPDLPLRDALQNAALEISDTLRTRAASAGMARGMSSTIALVLVHERHATVAHAGDSRVYLIRNRELEQLTRDHSMSQRLLDDHLLTTEEATLHPGNSVLTQAIGGSTQVKLDISEFDLLPGDALLLCSDGLWGYANQSEMQAIVTSPDLGPGGVADALLSLALRGGGGDNISIQFVRFAGVPKPLKPQFRFGLPSTLVLPLAGAAGGLFIAAIGLGFWNYLHPRQVVHIDATPPLAQPTLPEAPAQPASNVPPRPNRSVVIVFSAEGMPAPAWTTKLNSLDYIQVKHIRASQGCLTGKEPGALVSTPQTVAVARRIGKDLSLPDNTVAEIPRQAANSCAGAGLFILPSRPALVDNLKQKVANLGQGASRKTREPVAPTARKSE